MEANFFESWPLTTDYWLLTTDHWLLTYDHWPLTTDHRPLITDYWPLLAINFLTTAADHWPVTTDKQWRYDRMYVCLFLPQTSANSSHLPGLWLSHPCTDVVEEDLAHFNFSTLVQIKRDSGIWSGKLAWSQCWVWQGWLAWWHGRSREVQEPRINCAAKHSKDSLMRGKEAACN